MIKFNFFKKKSPADTVFRDINNQDSDNNMIERTDSSISIDKIKTILDSTDSVNLSNLLNSLSDIKNSVNYSISKLNSIIDDLENEKIVLEDQRFESLVHKTKSTVITSLRKETSNELPPLDSYDNALIFLKRMDSMITRFKDLSISHKKIFNFFINKYSNKMKNEIDVIYDLYTKSNNLLTKYNDTKKPTEECLSLITKYYSSLQRINELLINSKSRESDLKDLENKIQSLLTKKKEIEESDEYSTAKLNESKLRMLESDLESHHKMISELFGKSNRAFTKYSYGLNKEIIRKIDIMTNNPWKIFHEDNITDYYNIILDMKKSFLENKLQVKDQDKVISILNNILSSFESIKTEELSKFKKIKIFKDNNMNKTILQNYDDIKELIFNTSEEREKLISVLNQINNEIDFEKNGLNKIKKDLTNYVKDITGKSYVISD